MENQMDRIDNSTSLDSTISYMEDTAHFMNYAQGSTIAAEDRERFRKLISQICQNENALRMKGFRQHGSVSTYQHCIRVAWRSFCLNLQLRAGSDECALVRGAFLHDYYLYDWHNAENKGHATNHPCIAEQNAAIDFDLSDKERNIIAAHMWPLPLTRISTSREGWIVCLADKLCSLYETLFLR